MKPNRLFAIRSLPFPALILAGVLASQSAQAAGPYYWDNLAGAGFGTAGGTWSTTTDGPIPGWNTDASGTTAPASITTDTTDAVNFGTESAGQGLGTGTITVDTVSAGNITFGSQSGAIVLSGGTINLPAAEIITVNSTAATINSILDGAASVTKAGSGTLILGGTNTYIGATLVSAGTLTNGSSTTFTNKGTLSMSGTGIFDLAGFGAGFTNFAASTTGNTITNSGSADATLNLSSLTTQISALLTDGPTKKLAISLANNNTGTNVFRLLSPNTFSGGITLLGGPGNGTRLRITSAITTVGSAGAITSSPFGTGAITIGQVPSDKAQILLDGVANNTLANDIVINSALGTDAAAAIRVDTLGNVLSGAIHANLADAKFSVGGAVTASGVISGSNGVEMINSGIVTLTGTNTYTGPTQVSGGTLRLAGTGASNSSSGITINGFGAKFQQSSSVPSTPAVTLTQGTLTGSGTVGAVTVDVGGGGIISNNNGVAGASLTTGSLTFNGAATVNLFSSSTSAPLVAGALSSNLAGTVTINPAANLWSSGTYNLISYTGGAIGGAGFGQFALGTVTGLGSRQSVTLGNSGSAITLAIVGSVPVWTGALSTEWSVATLANPKNWALADGGGVTDFMPDDDVIFDDSAIRKTVDISNGNVTPRSVVFTNTTGNDYTLQGSNGIDGATGLNKTGTGILTITNTNSFTGATAISAGTLKFSGAGTLPTSSGLQLSAGATLDLNGTNQIITLAASAGNIANNSGSGTSVLSFNGNPNNGTPLIVDSTSNPGGKIAVVVTTNSQTFNTANTYSGGTAVNAGAFLYLGTGAGAGTGTITLSSPTSGLLFNSATVANDITGAGYTNINLNAAAAVVFNGTVNTTGGVAFRNSANSSLQSYEFASSGNSSLSGVIGGPVSGGVNTGGTGGRIIKSGSGTLTLSGANVYTGSTTISSGTLQIGAGGTTGSITSTSSVINNGSLVFNRSDSYGGDFIKSISGSGSITLSAGALTLSGVNSYNGNTTVSSGNLKLTAANASNESSSVTLASSGATLELGFVGTDTVDKLFIGATQMPAGVYGATGSVLPTIGISQILGSGTLTVTSGASSSAYSTWASAKGLTNLNNGVGQDPDKDGTTNLSEFAFNGNPLSGSSNGQFFTEMKDNNANTFKELTFTCAVRRSATAFTATVDGARIATIDGVTYTIEANASLAGAWNSAVSYIGKSDTPPAGSGLPSLTGADYEYRTFSAFDGGTFPKGFLRAKVTQP